MVFEDSILPVIKSGQAETIAAEGGKYRDVFAFHPTPGHSIGHMSISLNSGGEEALFTGDVMHNAIQVYKPHLGSVFCANLPLAQKSRLWLLNYAADRGSTLFTRALSWNIRRQSVSAKAKVLAGDIFDLCALHECLSFSTYARSRRSALQPSDFVLGRKAVIARHRKRRDAFGGNVADAAIASQSLLFTAAVACLDPEPLRF